MPIPETTLSDFKKRLAVAKENRIAAVGLIKDYQDKTVINSDDPRFAGLQSFTHDLALILELLKKIHKIENHELN